ncbi:MAG: MarR family transcriptional regulator [Verrucomicrobiota bacterium]
MSENPDTSGPHLWLVWWKAYHSIEKYDRQSIQKLGFATLSDFAVLEVLLHKGPQPVNSIGRRVLLTSGSITAAVDRAEAKGLVERRSSPTDRRVVEVHLTEAGQELIERAFSKHAEALEEVFAEFSSEERDTLYRLMKSVGKRADDLNRA